MAITILTLDTFRSVRFAHSHVLSKLAGTSLNAYYYTLRTDSCDHSRWSDTTVSKAVKVVPDFLETQLLFLSIDDTMVEKFGKKFELCSKPFDYAVPVVYCVFRKTGIGTGMRYLCRVSFYDL